MNRKPSKTPPPIGSTFQHVYHGEQFEMTVVEDGEGVGYEVEGQIFRSPTAAAQWVVGEHRSVNGWKFWNMDNVRKAD